MKKTVYTLNIDNYAPEIREITYPLIKYWARKIDADFYEITERKFPDFPVTYEKLQIKELGFLHKNDWNIYIDADALVHPETPDWVAFLKKDTICHNGSDMANIRWRYDKYFLRDGRNIGSCNWNTIASDWCLDLWTPLDISLQEALACIYPIVEELNTVVTTEHLIDDYTLSRNIARFGLKLETLGSLKNKIGLPLGEFYWHLYTISIEEKVARMKEVLNNWKIPDKIRNYRR